MKKFIFLSLILIAFAFVALPVSASNLPPPELLTVSAGQLQLDQVATINSMVEQTVTFTLQPVLYAYQAQVVMQEITELSNLPSTIRLNGNLSVLNSTKANQNTGQLKESMRQVARNAVINQIGFCNYPFNPNALIRML